MERCKTIPPKEFDFDGHLVDFDNMMLRLKAYKPQEEDHKCRVGTSGGSATSDTTPASGIPAADSVKGK